MCNTMDEKQTSLLEDASKGSLSFPCTVDKKEFTRNSRFKPIRIDELLRVLNFEDSPQTPRENRTARANFCSAQNITTDCDVTNDEAVSCDNILNLSMIEEESGIKWLAHTPGKVPYETPSSMYKKLCLNDCVSVKNDDKPQFRNMDLIKEETPKIVSRNPIDLFKTPNYNKMRSALRHQNIDPKESILSIAKRKVPDSDSRLQLRPKSQDYFRLNTPKDNYFRGPKFQPTPSSIQINTTEKQSTIKSDLILREKNLNVKIAPPTDIVQKTSFKENGPSKIRHKIFEIDSSPEEIPPAIPSKISIYKPSALSIHRFSETDSSPDEKPSGNVPSKISTHNPPPVQKQVTTSMPLSEATTFKTIKVRGNEYIMINKLGQGGSGQVYRCLEQETLQDRAIKVVNLAVDANTAANYVNEVKMLKLLQGSDRVIRMFDYEQNNQTLFVVMERGDVDFSVFLKQIAMESQIQTHIIICYWIEMLKCVREIHNNGIIHSDLKPSNFLLVGGRLKLIDFGIASKISSEMTSVIKNEQVGTFNYISPESLLDSRDTPSSEGKPRIRITYKSDVWSLGCILYQMIYRRTPFHSSENWMSKVVRIMDRNHRIDYPPVDGVPLQLIETIKKCLIYDMESRPSVEGLLNMYYIGKYC